MDGAGGAIAAKVIDDDGLVKEIMDDDDQPLAKRARVVIDPKTIQLLTDSYRAHFSDFAKSRKKVTQLIPNRVWTKVYADYLHNSTPSERFEEKTLRSRLRSALVHSGDSREVVSNDDTASEGAGNAHLDDDDLSARTQLKKITKSLDDILKRLAAVEQKQDAQLTKSLDDVLKAQLRALKLAELKVLLDVGKIQAGEYADQVDAIVHPLYQAPHL
ncbi:Uncharacterized protein PBTT_02842 [Plasmodiophora brassicae]|uniref:Uncharacterized protein n=1 Tax=Plasmodiophora brassicae TaxID=37360 RepID=A0A0G4J765_PLABS|nr:hypothetical protein PBRA_003218 [Plasmodiophora brassicae]SPQ95689.1 unnamed protein product [Plasmodiophora brassicae]